MSVSTLKVSKHKTESLQNIADLHFNVETLRNQQNNMLQALPSLIRTWPGDCAETVGALGREAGHNRQRLPRPLVVAMRIGTEIMIMIISMIITSCDGNNDTSNSNNINSNSTRNSKSNSNSSRNQNSTSNGNSNSSASSSSRKPAPARRQRPFPGGHRQRCPPRHPWQHRTSPDPFMSLCVVVVRKVVLY